MATPRSTHRGSNASRRPAGRHADHQYDDGDAGVWSAMGEVTSAIAELRENDARLFRQVDGLRNFMSESFDEVKSTLSTLQLAQATAGKTDAKGWFIDRFLPIAMAMLATIGVLWGLAIQPVQSRVTSLEESMREDRKSHGETLAAWSTQLNNGLSRTFQEIETQFKNIESVENMRSETNERFIALMWERVFAGEQFPRSHYQPSYHRYDVVSPSTK